jgi:hypothetical protein
MLFSAIQFRRLLALDFPHHGTLTPRLSPFGIESPDLVALTVVEGDI